MSAPSLTSIPPSFSSFPDLDQGPGKRPNEPSQSGRHERTKTKRIKPDDGLKGKDRQRKRSKERRKSYDFDDEERSVAYGDARVKDDSAQYRIEGVREKRERSEGHRKDRSKRLVRSKNQDKPRGSTDAQLNVPVDQFDEPINRIFYSDRKPDPLNIQYGGIHARDVPKYYVIARGRQILGLPHEHYGSRDGEGGRNGRRKMPALTDSSARALLASAPTRRVLPSATPYKYEEIDGFLQLPSRRGRDADQAYRSITLPTDGADSDSDSEPSDDHQGDASSSDDDEPEGTFLTAHQETMKRLEQQLTTNPLLVSNWLLLLSHTLSTIPITSKNATKARSEITLSILGRALSAHPSNASSKVLRLKYLRAGEDSWHESKLRAEWEDALKLGDIDVWMEWLMWRIRKGKNGIDGVVQDATRALAALPDDEDSEVGKIRIFWRVAVAFQDAGFSERATALFQAQAELTFEVPQVLHDQPSHTRLDALEEFWESEVPRVGESSAQGWAAWYSSGRHDPVLVQSAQTSPPSTESKPDPYQQWAYSEAYADRISRLPTRSTDESDPYSAILFADIRPLLLSLRSHKAKIAFRLAWLSVLGLHIPGFSSSLSNSPELNWDDRWNYSHLTSPGYLAAIYPATIGQRQVTTDAVAGVIVGREKEYTSGFGPVRSWAYGVLGPLDFAASCTDASNKGKGRAGQWGKEDIEGLDQGFVRRLFGQLRIGVEDTEWDLLALAFETAISLKSAYKLSRSFLSLARESLPLYAAHSRLEQMRGRQDDARKVYQTVLVASSSSMTGTGISQLWCDWAEMEWLAGKPDDALAVVLRAAGVEGRSSVVILRAKRNLDDAVKTVEASNGSSVPWKEQEGWIKLRALLEILAGGTPRRALTVFDEHLSTLEKGPAHESLLVACLLMLYQYGTVLKNPMPPEVLRERVEAALQEYPSNSVVLCLFLEGEKGQGVWGRVRGILGESGGQAKDVARRVQEVWIASWERGRWEGEIERTRSGLAAAVEHERTRASAIIWRIYIEFEVRAGQLTRAKSLLFRAIGECPLCKELYLLAFEHLRSQFSQQELNALADTMAERGIRMRRGVDEVLEGWELEEERKNEDIEDSGDEIAENARELRRLMPY